MKVKTSIEKKYSVIILLLVAMVVILCWCANALLLSRYYISRQKNNIEKMFEQLDTVASEHGIDSEQFKVLFESNASMFNCDMLILDQNMNVLASNVVDEGLVSERLLGYFFDQNSNTPKNVIKRTDTYTMQISVDFESSLEYMELWGVTSTGNPIVIRSALSGIQGSARIANILLAYIGIIALFISYFIVKIVSKTITQPILEIVDISDKMANLDFETKYEGNDENEIGVLGEHINKLSETLEKTISELKCANAELQSELKEKTELDDMRKEFLSNVSHELKTPIALIQGYAEGLTDCVNDDEESRNFYCEVITDEASKMNRLVRNLLNLNELEFGQNNVSIERFNIVELIRNCIGATAILTKQDDITVEFDDSKAYYVWSDEFKIEQVFNNYLSNAIHYAKGEHKLIKINLEQKADKLRISVYNSGDPIPDAEIQNIWTKFYKIDKARTREYGGSGVGLSIVKASMDALKQNYGVVNCSDGVSFWFEVDLK